MSKNLKGSIMLFIAAIIWGSAFVAQEEAVGFVGSFSLNCFRSIIGGLVLIPLILIFKKIQEKQTGESKKIVTRQLVIGGICCGAALALAANLQQFGIVFNASLAEGGSGKAGFITAMYIVFVPLISSLIGKKIHFSAVLAVIISVLGLYFISVKEGLSVSTGDIFLVICALAFSLHIMVVDHFVTKVDPIALSSIQFFTVSIISGVLMLIFERDTLSIGNITNAALPILFLGLMSSGVAYTLQVVSQRFTEPTIASLVMSLESLFAMITACIFYKHLPSLRETIGCVLMMVAIFVIETPFVDRAFNKIFKKKSAV